MDSNICKFHKYGHCKYGSGCRNIHSQNICSQSVCDKSSCKSRHPSSCRYYTRYGYCTFGTSCSFLHVNSERYSDIEKLKKDLTYINELLNAKENKIKALEIKVNQFQVFSCKNCGFNIQRETTIETLPLSFPLSTSLPADSSLAPSLPATSAFPPLPPCCQLPPKPLPSCYQLPAHIPPCCQPPKSFPPSCQLPPPFPPYRHAPPQLHQMWPAYQGASWALWGEVPGAPPARSRNPEVHWCPCRCHHTLVTARKKRRTLQWWQLQWWRRVTLPSLWCHWIFWMAYLLWHQHNGRHLYQVWWPWSALQELLLVNLFLCFCNLHVTPRLEDQLWSLHGFNKEREREWVGMFLRILNIEGHQNCTIDSKVTTILLTFSFESF